MSYSIIIAKNRIQVISIHINNIINAIELLLMTTILLFIYFTSFYIIAILIIQKLKKD